MIKDILGVVWYRFKSIKITIDALFYYFIMLQWQAIPILLFNTTVLVLLFVIVSPLEIGFVVGGTIAGLFVNSEEYMKNLMKKYNKSFDEAKKEFNEYESGLFG